VAIMSRIEAKRQTVQRRRQRQVKAQGVGPDTGLIDWCAKLITFGMPVHEAARATRTDSEYILDIRSRDFEAL